MRSVLPNSSYRGVGRVKWPSLVLGLSLLLASCGSEKSSPEESASTLPVERTSLVVAVSRSPEAVEAAGAAWARREGVDLELVSLEDGGGASASLREVRGPGDVAWLLQPQGLLVRLDALEDLGRDLTPPSTWPELSILVTEMARAGSGLGLPTEPEGLHELLLPLIWSAQPDSVATQPSSALHAAEAEEALAYLVQLSQHALRLPSAERDEAFLSGQIALLPCGLAQARRLQASTPTLQLRFWPWPEVPGRGAARAFGALYSLQVPPGAPHADLAGALARELAEPGLAGAVASAEDSCVPASRTSSSDERLFPPGFVEALRPWPMGDEDWAEAELLDEACDAALDLRRSPADALSEARRKLDG